MFQPPYGLFSIQEQLSERDWLKAIGAEEEGSDDDTGAGYVEETPSKKGKGNQNKFLRQIILVIRC